MGLAGALNVCFTTFVRAQVSLRRLRLRVRGPLTMADAAHRRPKRSPPGMIQPIIPKGGLEREESALPVARHPRKVLPLVLVIFFINRADQNIT